MRLMLSLVLLSLAAYAQEAKKATHVSAPVYRLELLDSVTSESGLAGLFGGQLRCDADGNIYFGEGTDMSVRKIDKKGRTLADFKAANQPDFQVQGSGYYFVGLDGEVFQVTFKEESLDRYLFEYRSDGTLKGKIKLDTGFAWLPNQVAVFPSGTILAAGQKLSRNTEHPAAPFTGLFTADGRLLREVTLSDDEKLMKMAGEGDPQVVSGSNRSSNRAVSLGSLVMAGDGNAYLMRRLNPAIIYVISPGGEVLRRFTVESAKDGVVPVNIHGSRTRIAIQFWNNDTKDMEIKVVDLEGNEVVRYENSADGQSPRVGTVFGCYTDNPDRFVFMLSMMDDKLGLRTYGPK